MHSFCLFGIFRIWVKDVQKKSKESKRIYNERVSSAALLTFCFCKTEFDYLGGLDSTKCKVKVEKSLLKAGESEFDAKC